MDQCIQTNFRPIKLRFKIPFVPVGWDGQKEQGRANKMIWLNSSLLIPSHDTVGWIGGT